MLDENGRVVLPEAEEIKLLPADGGKEFNRLIFESSPYLLQHASNPVDWYPWSEAAFKLAMEQDKPIFLSIGYATCHWCHVMEHESFIDQQIAAAMNETFICIKVDREERPDIDNVYMEVTQMLTGSGGWPMTVVMTPEKEPFFAGTYFPKNSRGGRIGMNELVDKINTLWHGERDSLLTNAKQITARIRQSHSSRAGSAAIDSGILDQAYQDLLNRFDWDQGGFGDAPKFPKAHDYSFLLQYSFLYPDSRALEMAEKSLHEMHRGGMYDQLGFGFHRYSVDKNWLVPHFEKMLYDQAILLLAYLDAYTATGDEYYAETAREISTYVIRDMVSPEGGFYSAEDADSEGEEGVFYVWSEDELHQVLSGDEFIFAAQVFNIRQGGNYPGEGYRDKLNIPHKTKSNEKLAAELGLDLNLFNRKYASIRTKLFDHREKRVHPFKDDKILTDWNGLMITALSRAGQILAEPSYLEAAESAMKFILDSCRDDEGKLLKRYRNGTAGLDAVLDDYAFMIWALTELYQITFNADYLRTAVDLMDYQLEHFWDESGKGFFFTHDQSEKLLVRSKEIYDGAIPSGNSVSAYNLVRLARITSNGQYEKYALETVEAFADRVNRSPSAYTMLMQAVYFLQKPSLEILFAGDLESDRMKELIQGIRSIHRPGVVMVHIPDGKSEIHNIIPFASNYKAGLGGLPLVYVCRNYTCKLPTGDLAEVIQQMNAED
ncbi:MAG: thioredoxin domain-containing protein [FCB group bacterium]|nr:thioredoxin domain-containing protein [FCB group bacterium]